MIRRSLRILVIAALSLGLFAAGGLKLAHADFEGHVSNITVVNSGTTVTYYVCVVAPSLPLAVGVAVRDQNGTAQQVTASYTGLGCGNGTYLMSGSATLPPGSYQFRAACGLLSDGNLIPCAQAALPFAGSSSGSDVENGCQVDFSTSTNLQNPRDCNVPGTVGSFGNPQTGPQPVPATATPTLAPTSTPTLTPTSTPTPVPTSTSVPTSTPTSNNSGGSTTGTGGGTNPSPGGGTNPGTGGGTNPGTSSGGSTPSSGGGATNSASASATPGSASPGTPTATPAVAVVSSSNNSSNGSGGNSGNNPGNGTGDKSGNTSGGSTGDTSGTSKGGTSQHANKQGNSTAQAHATAVAAGVSRHPATKHGTVRAAGKAKAKVALRVLSQPPSVRPGEVVHFTVAYVADALVQLTAALPGVHPLSAVGMTGKNGHATLSVTVPPNVALHNGHAHIQVALHALHGAWSHRAATATAAAVARARARLTVATRLASGTPVRVVVTFAGQKPRVYFAVIGARGSLSLDVAHVAAVSAPHGGKGHARQNRNQARAHLVIWSMRATQRAAATTALNVANIVIRVTGGPIVNCRQVQTAVVHYRPHTALKVLFSFADGPNHMVLVRTDAQGNATARATLTYVRAANPLRVAVAVGDATPRAKHIDSASTSVTLPLACRSSAPINVTVSS